MRHDLMIPALLCLILPQELAAKTVSESGKAVMACMKARNSALCRSYITEDSYALYDRFVAYRLMDCLPDEGDYVSHKLKDNMADMRTHIRVGKKEYATHLFLRKTDDDWKLDIPYTLEQGLGENWEKHVAGIEQGYLFLKGYMGKKLNCTMVRQLVGEGEDNAD